MLHLLGQHETPSGYVRSRSEYRLYSVNSYIHTLYNIILRYVIFIGYKSSIFRTERM